MQRSGGLVAAGLDPDRPVVAMRGGDRRSRERSIHESKLRQRLEPGREQRFAVERAGRIEHRLSEVGVEPSIRKQCPDQFRGGLDLTPVPHRGQQDAGSPSGVAHQDRYRLESARGSVEAPDRVEPKLPGPVSDGEASGCRGAPHKPLERGLETFGRHRPEASTSPGRGIAVAREDFDLGRYPSGARIRHRIGVAARSTGTDGVRRRISLGPWARRDPIDAVAGSVLRTLDRG